MGWGPGSFASALPPPSPRPTDLRWTPLRCGRWWGQSVEWLSSVDGSLWIDASGSTPLIAMRAASGAGKLCGAGSLQPEVCLLTFQARIAHLFQRSIARSPWPIWESLHSQRPVDGARSDSFFPSFHCLITGISLFLPSHSVTARLFPPPSRNGILPVVIPSLHLSVSPPGQRPQHHVHRHLPVISLLFPTPPPPSLQSPSEPQDFNLSTATPHLLHPSLWQPPARLPD